MGDGRLNYYLDTEFYEDGRTIDLISIAIVCEDGCEFYAVSREAELHRVSDWVRKNVLPHLPPYDSPLWMSRAAIRTAILDFMNPDTYDCLGARPKPRAWGYFADYDWIVLCQLFGTMMDLPPYMPKHCMDLKQLAVSKGDPKLPPQDSGKHDALADARWNMRAHAFLEGGGR